MAVYFTSDGIPYVLPQKRNRSRWLLALIEGENKKAGSIQYVFVSRERMLEINREFLQHDYDTDILTFPYAEGEIIAGDIFICVEVVRENAAEYDQTFENEMDRVISHGALHLLGYNDLSEEDQIEMTRMEDRSLALRSLFLKS